MALKCPICGSTCVVRVIDDNYSIMCTSDNIRDGCHYQTPRYDVIDKAIIKHRNLIDLSEYVYKTKEQ